MSASSFARQVASVALRTAPMFHEQSPADARWEALKEYLEAERVSNAVEARKWQADGSMAERYASRSIMAGKALAKMTELEAGQ